MSNLRKKIWVDRFQTHLFVRTGYYCLVFQAAIWLLVFIGLQLQSGLFALIGPIVAAFLLFVWLKDHVVK